MGKDPILPNLVSLSPHFLFADQSKTEYRSTNHSLDEHRQLKLDDRLRVAENVRDWRGEFEIIVIKTLGDRPLRATNTGT